MHHEHAELSGEDDGSRVRCLPIAHGIHANLFSRSWYRPASHAVHSRSDEALGATVWYRPATHVVTVWHTRSASEVGGANVYCPVGHDIECDEQLRSEEAVGPELSHSSAVHVVTLTHFVPSLFTEKVVPATQV